ncbi:MAG: hypothetical protein IJH84_23600, partial [Saccharopolyspora sp.]|uniref:hypothetical protein n=1 Tax=Saccharopolyspora sp. TaxID=33915 RepID=UPI0025EB58AD
QARVRSLLATVPLHRLRESGLLDGLLALAGEPGCEASSGDSADEPGPGIDEMAIDDLVQAALDGTTETD